MKVKYKRTPHSGRVRLMTSFIDEQKEFNSLEWVVFQKRMKESFPDVEFEEVPEEEYLNEN